MPKLFDDLQWRGLVYQTTDPALEDLLNNGQITAYIGFDPSADSLHVGSLLQLLNLRRLQLAGHTPIVLAGGSTGRIGDPSFKATERALLDDDIINNNIAKIKVELQQFLSFEGSNAALLVDNYEWTEKMSVLDFLRDVGKNFTVNSMIGKESVRARLEDREQGISFAEFTYSLLQALDFYVLFNERNCTLQMGASDQWGNIVAGIELIRKRLGQTAYGLCSPLVLKADGSKFGKTETGTVWLSPERTSPYAFYQFFFRVEDSVVVQYLKYFTFLTHAQIDELELATKERPQERAAQKALAQEVTTLVHGPSATADAIKASEALFSEEIVNFTKEMLLDVFAEAPSAQLSKSDVGGFLLVDALVEAKLSPSKSAARTAVTQGGAAVNNRKRDDVDATINSDDLLHGSFVILRRGKRDFAVLEFK